MRLERMKHEQKDNHMERDGTLCSSDGKILALAASGWPVTEGDGIVVSRISVVSSRINLSSTDLDDSTPVEPMSLHSF